jgi:hypothetical protein
LQLQFRHAPPSSSSSSAASVRLVPTCGSTSANFRRLAGVPAPGFCCSRRVSARLRGGLLCVYVAVRRIITSTRRLVSPRAWRQEHHIRRSVARGHLPLGVFLSLMPSASERDRMHRMTSSIVRLGSGGGDSPSSHHVHAWRPCPAAFRAQLERRFSLFSFPASRQRQRFRCNSGRLSACVTSRHCFNTSLHNPPSVTGPRP